MEWIFIFLWIIAFPIICAVIASAKGRSGIGWLIAGLFFGSFSPGESVWVVWVRVANRSSSLQTRPSMPILVCRETVQI